MGELVWLEWWGFSFDNVEYVKNLALLHVKHKLINFFRIKLNSNEIPAKFIG